MFRFFLRQTANLTIIVLCAVLGIVYLSSILPEPTGTLVADATGSRGINGRVFLDLDTGLAMQSITGNTRFTGSIPTSVQTLTSNLSPVAIFWQTQGETLYVVTSTALDGTTLYTLSLDDGQLTPQLVIPGLDTGFIRQSPDGRHVIFRAVQDGIIAIENDPKAMLLVDLYALTITDLGSPNFAYWSPDSQYLALGRATGNQLVLDVSIFDVTTSREHDLGVQTTTLDAPFFDTFQRLSVRWSPDSQTLAIVNQITEQLRFISQDGERVVLENVNLTPVHWSPTGEHLVTIGLVPDQRIGWYIVNLRSLETHRLNTANTTNIPIGALLWSDNGQTITVGRNRHVSTYNLQGQIVRDNLFVGLDSDLRPDLNTMRWLERK